MESVEAWEQIDEILAIPDFEVILAGPADLSASLGLAQLEKLQIFLQPQHNLWLVAFNPIKFLKVQILEKEVR